MKCSECGSENVESSKFCRTCGKSMNHSERTTKLMSGISPLPSDATRNESNDSSNNRRDKVKMENDDQDDGFGPYIDLKVIRKSSVKCAVGLGLTAIVVHFLVILLASQLKLSATIDPTDVSPHDPSVYFIQAMLALLFLVLLFTPMGVPPKGKITWSKIARDTFHQF